MSLQGEDSILIQTDAAKKPGKDCIFFLLSR